MICRYKQYVHKTLYMYWMFGSVEKQIQKLYQFKVLTKEYSHFMVAGSVLCSVDDLFVFFILKRVWYITFLSL